MDLLEQPMAETKEKTTTWKDFELEEHISAFIKRKEGQKLVIKPTYGDNYRVNVYEYVEVEGSLMGIDKQVNSFVLKITETDEGLTIKNMTR